MSHNYPIATLTQPIDSVIRSGHPWIFADAIKYDTNLKTGDTVDVVAQDGTFVARGIIEPNSPIRVRVWTTNPRQTINNQLLEKRIRAAAKRRPFPTNDTNGFRLLNGEGDRIPGVVCDIYDKIAVLRIDGEAAERWLKHAVRIVKTLFTIDYVAVRRSEIYRGHHPTSTWFGKKPAPDTIFTFKENGLEYYVDPIEGQKTGFFLDQRANRERISQLAVGKRLLNLFSYSGGFSLAAAAKMASHTTSVDLSEPALQDARRNFERNQIPASAHDFIAMDVFDYLDQFQQSSAPFEIAICDPPSFAHKKDGIQRALDAYVRLFSKLIDVMPPNSKCAFASCSSQIDHSRFLQILTKAAEISQTTLVSHGLWGADIDHPTVVGFPEGDYLQFMLVSLDK